MAGIVTLSEPSPETGVLYLDESGGYIDIGVNAEGYLKHTKFRVAPFNTSGGGYTTVGSSQEANIVETASNLVALIAAFYDSTAAIQALAVFQATSDHTGVLPTALDVSSASSAGTHSGGGALGPEVYLGFTAHTVSFAKWQVHLHAPNSDATNFGAFGGRVPITSFGSGDTHNFGNYLLGSEAGPGLSGSGTGLFTQVVAHSGEPLISPMYVITSMSRRIRRRFRSL